MRDARPSPTEVEQLLLNARLRDELEPYIDETMDLVNVRRMTTPDENEYLASMLAWEMAPVLPLSKWFEPELVLPNPDQLDDQQLHEVLWDTIERLYDKRIVIDFTDHLSDRDLFCLLLRDILPAREKKIDGREIILHWHCLDPNEHSDIWLRYYATDEERQAWAHQTGQPLPPSEPPPFPRKMPRRLC